jgi:hypothetical protein
MTPFLLVLALPFVPVAGDVAVHWRKKDVAIDALAELGPSPTTAARSWVPFAEKYRYRMTLTDDGRVLLLSPKNRSTSKELGLIEKTCAYVDEILPAPAGAEPVPVPPQKPAPGSGGEGGEPTWHTEFSWGAGEWKRDAETVVLVQASDAGDYVHAVEHLAASFDYLKSWVASARGFAGCTLEQPLAAIWLLADKDLEEWDPANELVHRLATLLVLRRFDRQPPWILQGLAWHVEYELRKTHYCFPWRSQFVFETEHTAWESMLKAFHRRTLQLRMDNVVALSRGNFQLEHARDAWGAASFLVNHHGDTLPTLLEDLRALQQEKGVVHNADGTWQRIPGYEPTAADQLPLLQKAAGEDVLAQLLEFYRKGK